MSRKPLIHKPLDYSFDEVVKGIADENKPTIQKAKQKRKRRKQKLEKT